MTPFIIDGTVQRGGGKGAMLSMQGAVLSIPSPPISLVS